MHEEIAEWRAKIDALDSELLRLLNQRAAIALEVGTLKQRVGLPLFDQSREELILARILDNNAGPLDDSSVTHIFRGILEASRRMQCEDGAGHARQA